MPVSVKYEPAEATLTTAAGPIVAATEQEGLWAVRYLGRALSAPSVPDLQDEIDRLDRTQTYAPAATGPVPATLRLGRDGRATFEDITVVGYATTAGLEVIRANGRRDIVPEERVYTPLDADQRAQLLALQVRHVQSLAHLDAVREGAARAGDVEGTIDVRYDHAGHHWRAIAAHDGALYGPFEERHASDAAHMARVALFCAQFPWTVEPAGTGVNLTVMAVPTEVMSTAPSYRTREDADRHVAAHRASRAARRALADFHDDHRFQAPAHFPLPAGALPDGEGRPV